MVRRLGWMAPLAAAAALVLVLSPIVHANGLQAQFHLGRMWTNPEDDGDAANVMIFPAGIPEAGKFGDGTSGDLKRSWVGVHYKGGNYLTCSNWTDPDATVWPWAGSYFFRTMNYAYPESYLSDGNFDYLYPIDRQEYLRFERPKVLITTTSSTNVDSLIDFVFFPGAEGLAGFVYPSSSGKGPRPTPVIDPDLVTEEVLMTKWRFIPGVELTRMTYGWGYGTQHQDYIVHDITLVNNGISGRMLDEIPTPSADAPVLEDQSLTDVVWARSMDFRTSVAPGTQRGKDEDCMYVQPWGDPGHYAVMAYDTDDDETPGPDWGDVGESEYYENLMLGTGWALIGALFTSAGPAADFATDDLEQPAFRTVWYERGLDMRGEGLYPNLGDVLAQREFLTDGSIHLPVNTSFTEVATTAPIAENAAGPTAVFGYGPLGGERTLANIGLHGWDLAWQDSVHIVHFLAASGVNAEEGRRIGALWNTRKQAGAAEASWMDQDDIDLYKTGEDSVMKAAALAYWNYNGAFADNAAAELATWGISDYATSKPTEYNQPYNTPDAPRPPGFISIRPNAAGGIEVRWGKDAEGVGDHDTKAVDVVGYRVYRQALTRLAPWVVVAEGPINWFAERAAAGAIPAGRFFIDPNVTAGQDYWYCVTAYDDGSQNWAQPGRSLESTRWWTWTGYSHIGVTAKAAGPTAVEAQVRPDAFALQQNVPNPFNPTTTIRFSVPNAEQVTLAVYAANGQLVRTLVDGSVQGGVHEVVWDGADQAGRPASSGVYVYRLTGETKTITKRMVLLK